MEKSNAEEALALLYVFNICMHVSMCYGNTIFFVLVLDFNLVAEMPKWTCLSPEQSDRR